LLNSYDIIEFPQHRHRINKLLEDSLQSIKSTNPLLELKLREKVKEIKDHFDQLASSSPLFSFTSSDDSLHNNEAALRSAVLQLTNDYNKIVLDLFSQLAVQKIEHCKLMHDK